jgi:acetyl-CoA acetyltransferase
MDQIQYIVLGNVISEVSYNNIARNAALVAGYPAIIPGHTVNMACMSSIQSITSCKATRFSNRLNN